MKRAAVKPRGQRGRRWDSANATRCTLHPRQSRGFLHASERLETNRKLKSKKATNFQKCTAQTQPCTKLLASHFSHMDSLIKSCSISVIENLNRVVSCCIKYFCTTMFLNCKFTDV